MMTPTEGNVDGSHVPVPDLVLACFLFSQSQGKSTFSTFSCLYKDSNGPQLNVSGVFHFLHFFSPHLHPQLFTPLVILHSRNSTNLTQSHEKQQLRAENCLQRPGSQNR